MHAKARLVPGAPRAARHPAPALTATNASQGAATPRPPKTVILRARASMPSLCSTDVKSAVDLTAVTARDPAFAGKLE